MVDQGWAKIYPTSPTGFIGPVDGKKGMHSWTEEKGLFEDNCIRCYQKINESIQKESNKYQSRFGFVPGFKAGLHLGEVTTGEIGTLKKEIVYKLLALPD